MPDNTPGGRRGLFDSLAILAARLVAIAYTRLDLLATDLEEEREHVFALLVLVLAAIFCLALGVVLATLLVVAAFWDTHRLLVLACLAGCFLGAGLAAWAYAMHRVKTKPRLFAASLAELAKDRQHLTSRS